ncbi:hypothetical protein LguiB_006032 [Lonicera macranthoides]
MQLILVVLLLVQLCLMNYKPFAQRLQYINETAMTKPGCPYRCSGGNNVTIPYPFGIGAECAKDETFVITCNTSFHPPRPYIRGIGLQVLEISIELDAWVKVEKPQLTSINWNLSSNSSKFSKTYGDNMLDWTISGNCSQKIDENQLTYYTSNSCSLNSLCIHYGSASQFYCSCLFGYEGNPYFSDGCQDVDECTRPEGNNCTEGCVNIPGAFKCILLTPDKKSRISTIGVSSGVGAIFFVLGLWSVYKVIKRRNKSKVRKKFFKRNGGLLLQKQLSSGEGNVEKSKLFTSKDLEKATHNYSKDRILGQGGQGTVYKGMLIDGRIAAVKVSTIVNEGNVNQFINEIVILSQINHRNIVKLYGCCLETEVPLLVYEFIPNGTLFQYIHEKNEDFSLSWDARLQIAGEVASALSYLHSSASQPIYHRDIKSANILLDEKYKAKVADFGTSRSIALDQTHLTTRVSGTFGYLDPEYFRTSRFTAKSDVYSFGVVLVELLTGQKPVSSTRSEEMRSLATYFMAASKEKHLFDILDARIQKEGLKEEITKVANLAKRCLNSSGLKRPTMMEVTLELEGIRIPNGSSSISELDEEDEYGIIELTGLSETCSTSTSCVNSHTLFFE